MWRAIWQLSSRRVLAWHLPVFLLLCGAVLFVTHPLGLDPPMAVLGAVQGWVLAYRLFVDPPGAAPFVFSRPFSRTRLFLDRWMIGLLLQGLTLVVIFAIVASGLRQAVQVHLFRSYWFPMVRWFELSTLGSVGFASLLTYQVACFVLLRRRLRGYRKKSPQKWAGNAAFLALVGLIAISFLVTYVTAMIRGVPHSYWGPTWADLTPWAVWLLSYTVVLVATTTLAALYCCRHFEVDA